MAEKTKKLYRSKKDRILFGVCGGLAKYFDFDPAIIRLLFIIAFLMDGIGILAYIILLILVPREPGELVEINRGEKVKEMVEDLGDKVQNVASEVGKDTKKLSGGEIAGFILVFLGCLVLLRTLFPHQFAAISWGFVWPFILIIIGLSFILRGKHHKK